MAIAVIFVMKSAIIVLRLEILYENESNGWPKIHSPVDLIWILPHVDYCKLYLYEKPLYFTTAIVVMTQAVVYIRVQIGIWRYSCRNV